MKKLLMATSIISFILLSISGNARWDFPAHGNAFAQILLRSEGQRLHFYFTMESALTAGTRNVFTVQIPNKQYSSLDEIVLTLRRAAPDASIFLDSKHADVLHIVDSSVKTLDAYPLANQTTTFSYTGTLSDLPEAIGVEQKIKIWCGNFLGSLVMPTPGLSSRVLLVPSGDDFRTALTDAAYKANAKLSFGYLWDFTIQDAQNGEPRCVVTLD